MLKKNGILPLLSTSVSMIETKILLLSTIALEVFDKMKIFSPNMNKPRHLMFLSLLAGSLKIRGNLKQIHIPASCNQKELQTSKN